MDWLKQPRSVCNASFDDPASFANDVKERGVRSVRMFPVLHQYPFQEWVVGPWLDWLSAERVPLWIPAEQVEPSMLHDVMKERRDLSLVLSEVHYRHVSWALPLLRSLPNASIEISRFYIADLIPRLIDAVGDQRILYGSRFPDSPMAPHLYNLHRSDLSEASLTSICSGNLDRLLAFVLHRVEVERLDCNDRHRARRESGVGAGGADRKGAVCVARYGPGGTRRRL